MDADASVELTEVQTQALKSAQDAVQTVYGRRVLNVTTRPACFKFLYELLETGPQLGGKVDYLEIGSFQGASLVVIGCILRSLGRLGSICSIDPYFPEGYHETPPFMGETILKKSNEDTMQKTLQFYEAASLDVEHIRDVSSNAVGRFLTSARKFDFIFIDGNHEKLQPMVDMALSLQVIRPGGYIMLDDINWPDVQPVVRLCTNHLKQVARDFGKVCFEI